GQVHARKRRCMNTTKMETSSEHGRIWGMMRLLVFLSLLSLVYSSAILTGQKDDAAMDGMWCPICKDLIKGGEQMGEDELVDWIAGYVKPECDKLPLKKLQQDCFNAIMGKVDDLVVGIISKADPQEICTLATLC
ncbi:hypothetical protein PMAYCL1PPCAC_02598, partial [Pristionchus mayeri]